MSGRRRRRAVLDRDPKGVLRGRFRFGRRSSSFADNKWSRKCCLWSLAPPSLKSARRHQLLRLNSSRQPNQESPNVRKSRHFPLSPGTKAIAMSCRMTPRFPSSNILPFRKRGPQSDSPTFNPAKNCYRRHRASGAGGLGRPRAARQGTNDS